jgi:hypothetical protein
MANFSELINLSTPVTFQSRITTTDGRTVSNPKFFTSKSLIGRVASEAIGQGTFTFIVKGTVKDDLENWVTPVSIVIKSASVNSRQRLED